MCLSSWQLLFIVHICLRKFLWLVQPSPSIMQYIFDELLFILKLKSCFSGAKFCFSIKPNVCSVFVFAQDVCFRLVFTETRLKVHRDVVHMCVFLSVAVHYHLSSFYAVAGQALVISVEPRTATVRQGESVSFRCQVGSAAQPIQLEWRRGNNQALPGQGERHVTISTISQSVRFNRLFSFRQC